MRQLLLTAALSLCACTDTFHSVGFYNRVDTTNAGNKAVLALGTGDLNGDGRADVILADDANEVNVLFSKGDGNFATGVSYPIENLGNQPRSIVIGDLNNDGRADVVVGNINQNTVQVFINQGDGRLVALQPTSLQVNCKPSFLVLHDMTGDGRLDLVIGCGSPNEVHILKNQGAGPAPGQPLSFGGMYIHKWTTATGQSGSEPAILGFAVGELNGDNTPDIAVATMSDLRILNSPRESVIDYQVSMPLTVPTMAVALGDVTGNGVTDISALTEGKSVQVFEYATGGAYNQVVAYQNLGINGRTTTPVLKVADLSSDGKSDLLLTLKNPTEIKVAVSRSETGIVTAPVTLSYQYPASDLSICDGCVSLGDLNGDGKLDLVLHNNGSKISVLLNASH